MIDCPQCKTRNLNTAKFCDNCGTQLKGTVKISAKLSPQAVFAEGQQSAGSSANLAANQTPHTSFLPNQGSLSTSNISLSQASNNDADLMQKIMIGTLVLCTLNTAILFSFMPVMVKAGAAFEQMESAKRQMENIFGF